MAETNNYYIHNANIVNEDKIFQGDILVQNGKIARIMGSKLPIDEIAMHPDTRYVDATGYFLLPGGIDEHVHFREPGLTHKGCFESESRAAVAGGICSILDMPNTIPQTTTCSQWEAKQESASGKMYCNYAFYIGATSQNLEEVKKADKRKVAGVKLFLGSSTGDMLISDENIIESLFKWQEMPLLAHCESEPIIRANTEKFKQQYGENAPFRIHTQVRSEEACYQSSLKAIKIAQKYHTPLHILHISTEKELSLLDERHPQITMEVCPSYLFFSEKDYDRLGCKIKCNPSIKTEKDKEALLQALKNNRIQCVGSDHAPHCWEEKNNSYFNSPSGMPMVQHSLLVLLELCYQKKLKITQVANLLSHHPAKLLQIEHKGFIREGYDADLVLVDLEQTTVVNRSNCYYQCQWSPLEGECLHARIRSTFVNGCLAYDNGTFSKQHFGKPIIFNR